MDERTERQLLAIQARSMNRSVHEGKLTPTGQADLLFRYVATVAAEEITLENTATGKRRIFQLEKTSNRWHWVKDLPPRQEGE